MAPDLARRIHSTLARINGWFSIEAALLFSLIDEVQRTNRVAGPLFEIGVHEGRSAIFLAGMVRPGEEFLAVCDIFEQQGGNVSGSGQGKRDLFERNMRALAPASLDLRIFPTLSGNLTSSSIGHGYRFFHIDGGHNAGEALADLRLGASVICSGGVMVVDDPFRPEWPGVTEGVVRFLDEAPDFRAVAVGFNKLLVARASDAQPYRDAISDESLRKSLGLGFPWHLKELPFVGQPLLIYYVPTTVSGKGSLHRLYRRLRRG